ncbi:MAG: hypothetical protein E6J90_45955 [Deltaproteobacteria bacterium]|nr:MAG: hypothetical protein E6J90_45955 [Deltaproteobacteria bacterium]
MTLAAFTITLRRRHGRRTEARRRRRRAASRRDRARRGGRPCGRSSEESAVMSRHLRGSCLVITWFAVVLGAGCSADDESTSLSDLPVLPVLRLTFDEDQPIVIHPLIGVTDPKGRPLTIVQAASSTTVVTIGDNGQSLEVAPKLNFFGMFSITYQVSNGGPTRASSTVTVTVNSVNDPPVAVSSELTVRRSAKLPLAAADVEHDPLSLGIVTQPQHGVVQTATRCPSRRRSCCT